MGRQDLLLAHFAAPLLTKQHILLWRKENYMEHFYRQEQTARNTANANQTDHGPKPYAVNIARAAQRNQNFRTALWTGLWVCQ